jgi:hypothetical protein
MVWSVSADMEAKNMYQLSMGYSGVVIHCEIAGAVYPWLFINAHNKRIEFPRTVGR